MTDPTGDRPVESEPAHAAPPPADRGWQARFARLREADGAPALLLLGTVATFLACTNHYFPLQHWLFFTYLRIWGLVALFGLPSLAVGLRLLSWLLPEPPRLGERLLLGFALGVLTFFVTIFVGGVAGLYGPVFFFAAPVVLAAVGARSAVRELRRVRAHLRRFGARLILPGGWLGGLGALTLGFGMVAVYIQVLTPTNVGADAVWYHLAVAEHYAKAGGVRPFVEGWYNGTLPQLASFLYTWAFQAPVSLFEQIALSAHVELLLFIATVPGVAVLVRRLIGARAPFAGALLFAFPGFLLYDSNLIIGADHVLAFWAPPLAIALLRLARKFEVREGLLAGAFTAATLLTKYQGIYFLAPAGVIVTVAAVRLRRWRPWLAWAAAMFVLTSAHWLKNWVFYGDPLYPHLRAILPSHPFVPGAAELMNDVLTPMQFRFLGTPLEKLRDTLLSLVSFAFVPHDWDFHGRRPVFGALFTCSLVALPFLRPKGRLWALVAAIHVGIAIWWVTAHEDRYLQALLPWMVAACAAILHAMWKRGHLSRAAVIVALLVQAVYGDDVYFYRMHAMSGDAPLKGFVDWVALGQIGKYQERFNVWASLQDNTVAGKMSKGGKLLAHQFTEKLGAGVPSVLDGKGWQGGIDYLAQETPADTLRLWRGMGITHVWWDPTQHPRDDDVLAREAVFQHAVAALVPVTEVVAGYRFGAMGSTVPAPAGVPTRLGWFGCGQDKPSGAYLPREFARGGARPAAAIAGPADLSTVSVVLHRDPCPYPSPEIKAWVERNLVATAQMGEVRFFTRRFGY